MSKTYRNVMEMLPRQAMASFAGLYAGDFPIASQLAKTSIQDRMLMKMDLNSVADLGTMASNAAIAGNPAEADAYMQRMVEIAMRQDMKSEDFVDALSNLDPKTQETLVEQYDDAKRAQLSAGLQVGARPSATPTPAAA